MSSQLFVMKAYTAVADPEKLLYSFTGQALVGQMTRPTLMHMACSQCKFGSILLPLLVSAASMGQKVYCENL